MINFTIIDRLLSEESTKKWFPHFLSMASVPLFQVYLWLLMSRVIPYELIFYVLEDVFCETK